MIAALLTMIASCVVATGVLLPATLVILARLGLFPPLVIAVAGRKITISPRVKRQLAATAESTDRPSMYNIGTDLRAHTETYADSVAFIVDPNRPSPQIYQTLIPTASVNRSASAAI
jgi:hypothetical protein